MKDDYYRETISEALHEIGKGDLLTESELDTVAHAVAVSRDNESMAFGYDCIPNPANADIRKLEQRIKEMEAYQDKREKHWRNAVSWHLKIPSEDVSLDESCDEIRRVRR